MLSPDTRLRDRYRILQKIGGGGFGYVYKAIDEVFGCTVAIKETREGVANQEKLRKAFEREAKLLRNLKHDALPRVTDYFFEDQAQFLVMDFIEGEDLASLLKQRLQRRQGPFAFHEILPWVDQILNALEYLHSRPEPIIHRDIKPANIKLADDGGIYLLDFGLAKGVTGQMSTIVEGQPSSVVIGFTREYAPLEQLQDTANKPQSDVFALAATLYHLLTGHLPIAVTQRDEALQRGQADPLRPAHELNSALSVSVSEIISRAMAIRWWDRTDSAKEMRRELHLAATQDGDSAEPSALPTTLLKTPELPAVVPPLPDATPPEKVDARLPAILPVSQWSLTRWGAVVGVLAALLSSPILIRYFLPTAVAPGTSSNPAGTPTEMPAIATSIDLSLKKTLDARAGGHSGIVWSVAFSPDGGLAASASEDKTIILWDTQTWKAKRLLSRHDGPVYSVAFSVDGKTLASGSRDKTIRLWNLETGLSDTLSLEDTRYPVLRLSFSPDGNFLASCSGERPEYGGEEIRIWEVRNGWKSKVLEGNAKSIFAVAFSPDGRTLASAGLDKKLRLWDLTGNVKPTELSVEQALTTLAFSGDGKYVACGSQDATIKLWRYQLQPQAWQELEPLGKNHREHSDYITSTAFSPDDKTLVAASADGVLRLWDVAARTSKPLSLGQVETKPVQWSATFSPDGHTLVAGGQDYSVRVWQ